MQLFENTTEWIFLGYASAKRYKLTHYDLFEEIFFGRSIVGGTHKKGHSPITS